MEMASNTGDHPSGKQDRPWVTEALALSILGETRFLAAYRVAAAWNNVIGERRAGQSIPPVKISGRQPVPYTEATLKKVAADPAWCLFYDPGFSIRDNREITGADP